ncbi:MAG: hypothetical protein IKU80_01940 [Firmicutes bacterium]|nr:hypothetical protein [Bacillota bacterium]
MPKLKQEEKSIRYGMMQTQRKTYTLFSSETNALISLEKGFEGERRLQTLPHTAPKIAKRQIRNNMTCPFLKPINFLIITNHSLKQTML